MGQVQLAPNVDWLNSNYKVLKPYKQSSDPINIRLAQSDALLGLIERNNFVILTARGRNVCLYFELPFPADSPQLYQLKRDANLLVKTFTLTLDLSSQLTDIEQLKRDEQQSDEEEI